MAIVNDPLYMYVKNENRIQSQITLHRLNAYCKKENCRRQNSTAALNSKEVRT